MHNLHLLVRIGIIHQSTVGNIPVKERQKLLERAWIRIRGICFTAMVKIRIGRKNYSRKVFISIPYMHLNDQIDKYRLG